MDRDITPVLADAVLVRDAVRTVAAFIPTGVVTDVAALESRGFRFGAALALALGAGVVPIRTCGWLPRRVNEEEYTLEHGIDRLAIHTDAFDATARVVVMVDDVLATGGTAAAAVRPVERAGDAVAGYPFLLGLESLGGRGVLQGTAVDSVLRA